MSGGSVPDWTIEAVSDHDIETWCALMRDRNPIHLDADAAQALGFGPRVVNPGPANLAYLFNMMLEAMPGCEILEVSAMFHGNAQSGDRLCASGAAVDAQESVYDAQLTCEGRVLVRAQMVMGQP